MQTQQPQQGRICTFLTRKKFSRTLFCRAAHLDQQSSSLLFFFQSMDLSLQAIDFLFAKSIQDGWLLSDMGCKAEGIVGDDCGPDNDGTLFCSHLSSCGFSRTFAGLNSERKNKRDKCHEAALYFSSCN